MKIAIFSEPKPETPRCWPKTSPRTFQGIDVSVTNLSEVDPADLVPGTLYLIVCSTYGDGELPASAKPFGARMQSARPDLTGIHFAVFGMGDSEYPETFNGGGRRSKPCWARPGPR